MGQYGRPPQALAGLLVYIYNRQKYCNKQKLKVIVQAIVVVVVVVVIVVVVMFTAEQRISDLWYLSSECCYRLSKTD